MEEDKYIEKKVIRHIKNNLSDFSSSSDGYEESDEEKIKATLEMCFLINQFQKCLYWESNRFEIDSVSRNIRKFPFLK